MLSLTLHRRHLRKLIAAILVIAAFVSTCLADYQAWNISYSDTSYLLSDIITEDMTEKEKICAIASWTANNIEYDYSKWFMWKFEDKENLPEFYIVDIESILETGKGICLDKSAICVSLLINAGFEARIAVCNGGHHAVAAVRYNNEWYALDVTNKKSYKITDKITSKTLPEMAADEYKLY